MGLTYKQRLYDAIEFLETYGYTVIPNFERLKGQWVVYKVYNKQEVRCLYGEIAEVSEDTFVIVSPEQETLVINKGDVTDFFDTKEECLDYYNMLSHLVRQRF